jgi:cytochrome c peroxidase
VERLLSAVVVIAVAVCSNAVPGQGSDRAAAERDRIVALGPWPPAITTDPSNRVSGQPAAIGLGRRLFFDAALSPSGRVACSSCHRPERAWTDGRARGVGLQVGHLNTPSLYNVSGLTWLGWGGAGDSLWAQSVRPLLDPREMGASASHVQSYLGSHPELGAAYAAAFGRGPHVVDPQTALVDAAKALAAYQETFLSPRTAFDAYRDALAAGDAAGMSAYPAAARRGLSLFIGKGGCATCHDGSTFGGNAFADIGRRSSPGTSRARGVADVLASPYSLSSRHNDAPQQRGRQGTHVLMTAAGDERALRVPPLRNAARTAPWLHDGTATTLSAAIRAHRQARTLRADEIGDLVRFLETLSDPKP